MSDRRSVLRVLAWVLPAGFLAFTGVAKLVAPEGTPPASLRALADLAPWPVWLRGMGALELAVTALLVVRRTRLAGAYTAFVLLAALSTLVALNAHDSAFLADCGCMGAVRLPAASWGEVAMLLVRNGVLLFLLALVPYLRPGGPTTTGALARAGTAAAFVVLALLATAERTQAEDARQLAQALEQGATKGRTLGWRLPPLPLVAADGSTTTLAEWAQPLDTLLFVSTHCAHCPGLGPSLPALKDRVAAQQGRLVVVVVGSQAQATRAWIEAHGFSLVPHARLPATRDAYRLGLDGVPAWLSLDRDRRVATHESHGGHVSLAAALSWSAGAVPELAAGLANALAVQVAGPAVKAVGFARQPDGSWSGSLLGSDGPLGRLVVRADGVRPGHALELAVGLDGEQRILGVVPLARGSLVPLLAPDIAGELVALKGLTVPAALAHAEKRLDARGLSSSAWHSVYRVLERLRKRDAPP